MEEKIRLYQLSTCPYCARVREVLEVKGVEFEIVNVPQDKADREELFEISAQRLVPVLVVGEEVVSDSERIIEFINGWS